MPDLRQSGSSMGTRTASPPDHAVARLADRQHGVVSREQLLDLGLTPKAIRVRLRGRRLVPLHRGVYAVGHARLTRQGEWLAAVLAAGRGAALSHRSAAVAHRLLPERGRRIDVTSTRRRARTNWIETHHTRALPVSDLTRRDGILVTTVSRTLVDLADVVDARELERAVNEADVERVLDVAAIDAGLRRACGRRGGGDDRLRGVLARHHGPVLLRSELERRFRTLLAAHALPAAEHNVRVAGWEVDACWPAARLVVELDSRRYHDTLAARARDARKQQELEEAGWTVLRYRKRHLTGGAGAATAEELGRLLRG